MPKNDEICQIAFGGSSEEQQILDDQDAEMNGDDGYIPGV